MVRDDEMLSIDELIQEQYFADALYTFYEMQKWGAENYKDVKRTGHKISDMLRGEDKWESMSDTEHQRIGYLIARNFPNFAALCTIPVYVVFEQSDGNRNGIYRLATYTQEKE